MKLLVVTCPGILVFEPWGRNIGSTDQCPEQLVGIRRCPLNVAIAGWRFRAARGGVVLVGRVGRAEATNKAAIQQIMDPCLSTE